MFFKKKIKKENTENVENVKKTLNEFQKNILKSDFETAYEIAKTMPMEKVFEELYVVAEIKMITDLPYNVLSYVFVTSVLMKQESVEYHMLAADLMTMPYLVLPGACEVALWHSRQALKLDSNCKRAAGMIAHLYEHEVTSATEEEYQNALKVIQE